MEKGLNSDNFRRLFRKPTLDDMIILIILALAIGSYFMYTYELNTCREFINENCIVKNIDTLDTEPETTSGMNITFNLKPDNNAEEQKE